ncbi:unnamed protein product [Bemisia tabaci]|uniref:Phosphatidylethanolamine-binding protein n=1 Tax=Bemisia tabaci TaxID=7038 RepID=A0A9P0F3K6_BEMTA|nr:unnamed protein product [Bemisia tabaci]
MKISREDSSKLKFLFLIALDVPKFYNGMITGIMLFQEVLTFILSAIILCLFIIGVYPHRDYEYVSEEDYPHFKIIKAAMEKHKIIPDLHKLFTFYTVQTKFMNGSKSAQMGNELSKEDTQEPPHISYCHDDDAYYTIIMSDLDAPTPGKPYLREWLHWLVVNIPRDNITAGETLGEYIAPVTKNFTGRHRYVITAYRQPGGFRQLRFHEDRLDNKSDVGRVRFSTNTFANDYNYGDPWAMNFWYMSHDNKRWHK